MFYKRNTEQTLDPELFRNPTSEYRGTPFWAWNCKLDTKTLGEQIECLHEMGFGGFHMHSRTGMALPYLKEDFMNCVRFCTDKAKAMKMLAYLYDEDRWPSGFAGGYITKNPRFRQKMLVFSTKEEEHFPDDIAYNEGKTCLLAAFDVVLNEKGELASYRRIAENDAAEGKKWFAYVKVSKATPWFNNQTYADTLDKETIDEFIKVTYNAYERAVGDEFGKTVPSIFTDEPQFARKAPLGFADSCDDAVFPWTHSMQKSFSEKYGYDLVEKLPELIWNLPDGKMSRARYHYHDHICDKFTESFADNCGAWCHEHGIALTGHMMQEPSLESQTGSLGETMRSYRAFEIPGIDMLCDYVELTTAKQCQSAVHQYGREAMISELYGVTNWDFDFRGHKFQGDWQAALGVTIRVPHLSWVSMAGEAKRDYPATINYQSPWHKEYKYIEDHFARVNTALTRGKPVEKIAVIHPVESYWINFGPKENTLGIREQLDEKFGNITKWLLFGTMDFDFVSESLLPEQYAKSDSGLCVGKMKYDVVVVPDCLTLRRTTLDILTEFESKGGRVIFAGECPKYVDAEKSDDVQEFYRRSVCVPFDRVSILDALSDFRIVEIKDKDGSLTDNLLYNMRRDNDCDWLFIAHGNKSVSFADGFTISNPSEVTAAQKTYINIRGEYTPTLYDTLSGEIRKIPYSVKDGKTFIEYDFHTRDSLLLRLSEFDGKEIPQTEEKCTAPSKTIRISGKVDFKRSEPNVLLLDRAEYSLNGGDFRPEEEILILDNICREEMGWPCRGTQLAQPWVVEDEPVTNSIALRFTINSEIAYSGAHLAAEDAEKLRITFNGTEVSPAVDGWYTDKAIKTVPLPEIRAGKNELILQVPFGKRTNTEWCYILGDFGVKVEGTYTAIVPDSSKIGFSTLTSQGMPFYGGNIIYKAEIETPECTAVIRTVRYRGALVKVIVDGKERGVIALSPYELKIEGLSAGKHTVELVLFGTRINTFGGMHNVRQHRWVGPNFWRSIGDNWCYEYILKDTGILASPIIEIFEK